MKIKMSLLNAAKNADYVFISVMGPHAQEGEDEILSRKVKDVKKAEKSFWVSKIWAAKAIIDKKIEECKTKLGDKVGYLILVEGNAKDTKSKKVANQYSKDNKKTWENIDDRITNVTGNWGDKGAIAYYFDDIVVLKDQDELIDLDYYCEVDNDTEAIKFRLGYSNVFAKKNTSPMPGGMKNHERKIVAVLRLKYPYVVWVK